MKKATEIVEKQVFHFQARRFACADDALADLQIVARKWKYHAVKSYQINELSDAEVVAAYKQQQQMERGFRFLKDPLFFASSLFLKNPKRIMVLLMVMLLSLLVYGIAGVWDC